MVLSTTGVTRLAWSRTGSRAVRGPLFAIGAGGVAAVSAYALVAGHSTVAIAVSVFPLAAWLFARPAVLLVILGASIPAIQSLTGGGGFNVSASDVLLVLVGAGILALGLVTGSFPAVRALRPVRVPVLQYGAFMLLLLPLHPSVNDLAKTAQRFELFLLPLVVGAFAVLTGKHLRVLQAYILGSTVLAVLWQFDQAGMQKNPVGQMIANAILLLVAVRSLRPMLPCLVVLVPGLFLTGSRGAVLALVLGLAVVLVMHGSRARLLHSRAFPLAAVAAVAFAFLTPALQSRLTTFSANRTTSAGYAVYLRTQFSQDAHRIITAHPLIGVGVGNFGLANASSSLPVEDPHQVLLLQAAEGGYGFATSFVLLIAGSALVLFAMRRVEVAAAAAAVLIATFAHGLVDVYWVRGTPVLGWLLIGMACGQFAMGRHKESIG